MIGAVADEVERDQWITVSSLVRREDLPTIIPNSPILTDEQAGRYWRLELPVDDTLAIRRWWLLEQKVKYEI